ncbi:MAG: hypothetical protein ACOYJS_02020 [Acutalibacteraceae bacterium]|jgi:hypothetical protein
MQRKFFDKTLPPRCEYCQKSSPIGNDGEMVCRKHGITRADDYCKSYKYDPLKRIPRRKRLSDNYSADDFSL